MLTSPPSPLRLYMPIVSEQSTLVLLWLSVLVRPLPYAVVAKNSGQVSCPQHSLSAQQVLS